MFLASIFEPLYFLKFYPIFEVQAFSDRIFEFLFKKRKTIQGRKMFLEVNMYNDMGHLTSKLQACQKCEVAGWGAVNQDPKDPIYPRRE